MKAAKAIFDEWVKGLPPIAPMPKAENMARAYLAQHGIGPKVKPFEPRNSSWDQYRIWSDIIDKTMKEVEAEMKVERAKQPYWMVHRRGEQSGPATRVHHSFSVAIAEAIRLARQEMDSFDVMESVFTVKPQMPVEVDIEPFDVFGDYFEPQTGVPYPSSLDHVCTCDPDAGEGCKFCQPWPEGYNDADDLGKVFSLDMPTSIPSGHNVDVVDALALSLAEAFGIPSEFLQPVDCCDADCGHEEEPIHPFAHDPDEPCRICEAYALEEPTLGPEHEIGDEDCEICAGGLREDFLESISADDVVVSRALDGGLSLSVKVESECGFGCTDECVSSNCAIHAGELYQPEPEEKRSGYTREAWNEMVEVVAASESKGCCDENEEVVANWATGLWRNYRTGCTCNRCVEAREQAQRELKEICGR